MGKTGDTKKKIIEILRNGNKTLTDISNELDLAPSTVSQHLHELEISGTIKPVDADRPRKWKYYELSNRNNGFTNSIGFEYAKKIAVPLAVVALSVIAAFLFYRAPAAPSQLAASSIAKEVYLAPGASVPKGSTIFTVSDAPAIYNISALVITVANASIQSRSTGKRYSIPLQSNTFDLVKLRNISTILSGVNLSSGSYDNLQLYVTNATAVVNGKNENVFLPSSKLTILGSFNINGSLSNWINLDFDLAHSLHIMTNGQLVMLPVINIRHVYDRNLQLDSNSIVIAKSAGRIEFDGEVGMSADGTMYGNYSAQQNISIEQLGNGKLGINGNSSIPIIVRSRKGLLIDIIQGVSANSIINANYWKDINASNSNAYDNGTVVLNNMAVRRSCLASNTVSAGPNCCPVLQSSASADSSETGNGILEISNIAPSIDRYSCCYPVYIHRRRANIVLSRCIPIGIIVNSSSGHGNPEEIAYYNQSFSSSSKINISATALNDGYYDSHLWGGAKASVINISVHDSNGTFDTGCMLANGAISCTQPTGFSIGDAASRISGYLASWISGNSNYTVSEAAGNAESGTTVPSNQNTSTGSGIEANAVASSTGNANVISVISTNSNSIKSAVSSIVVHAANVPMPVAANSIKLG